MPRNHKTSTSNGHSKTTAKKLKDKPTYKIIVLGTGGVGKVRFFCSSSSSSIKFYALQTYNLSLS
jgi:hypothetical protein